MLYWSDKVYIIYNNTATMNNNTNASVLDDTTLLTRRWPEILLLIKYNKNLKSIHTKPNDRLL